MNRKKYLAKNTALFALNSIGTKLIIFLLVPVYTKSMTTSEFGVADLVTTLSSIIVPIITLNINEAVMRFSLDDNADYNKIMSIGISVMALSIFCGAIIIPVSHFWVLLRPFSLFFYLYCVFQGIYSICSSYLRGRELLTPFAISNIVVTLSGACLNIIFLVFLKFGVKGYFLGFIISYILGIIYSIIASNLHHVFKHFSIDRNLAKKMCSYSLVLIPNSLMWWVMNASDRLMVISIAGVAANGLYAISYKIPSAISTASVVFNQAWSYSAIHEEFSTDRDTFNEKMYNFLFELQLLITGILLLGVKPIMSVYVDNSFYPAWQYIPPLLIGYFFMSLGTFFSTQYTVKKDSKGFLVSGTIGAAVNVVLNFLMIPILGPLGAAIATASAYLSVFVFRVHDTRKYFHIKWITVKKTISAIVLTLMAFSNYISEKYSMILLCFLMIIILLLAKETIYFTINTCIDFMKRLRASDKFTI